MTEQFGFDQFGRHRRAIQRDERRIVPRRFFMNRTRTSSFLCPSPEDAHAGLASGDALDLSEKLFIAGPEPTSSRFPVPLQFAVFIFQPRQPQRIFNGNEQFVSGKRLLQKIQRAKFRRLTAISILACPEMSTIGVFTPPALSSSRRSSPLCRA